MKKEITATLRLSDWQKYESMKAKNEGTYQELKPLNEVVEKLFNLYINSGKTLAEFEQMAKAIID